MHAHVHNSKPRKNVASNWGLCHPAFRYCVSGLQIFMGHKHQIRLAVFNFITLSIMPEHNRQEIIIAPYSLYRGLKYCIKCHTLWRKQIDWHSCFLTLKQKQQTSQRLLQFFLWYWNEKLDKNEVFNKISMVLLFVTAEPSMCVSSHWLLMEAPVRIAIKYSSLLSNYY